MIQYPIRVLLIEDNPSDALLIQGMLDEFEDNRFNLVWVERLSEGMAHIQAGQIDVIITDLALPDSWGLDTFRKVLDQAAETPIIVLSGFDVESMALEAVTEGAQDYLIKGGLDSDRLSRVIHYAIERKRLERALRINEYAIASSIEGIAATDLSGTITCVNRAFLKMVGCDEADAVGRPVADLIPFGGDAPGILRTVHGEGGWIGESAVVNAQGSRIEAQVSVHLVSNKSGNPLCILFSCVDITERKSMEKALRESEERLELAIKGADLYVWDWDIAADRGVLNNFWHERAYSSPAEGDSFRDAWCDLIHPDDIPHVMQALDDHIAGKIPCFDAEYRLKGVAGNWIGVHSRGEVTKWDPAGRPIRCVGISQDVTMTQQYRHSLCEVNKKLNLLSSITRHDILNSIMAVMWELELLKEEVSGSTAEENLQGVIRAVRAIQSQIMFTRDYQDLGVKGATWQCVNVVVQEAADSAASNAIRLNIAMCPLEIYADQLLERVFFNLIDDTVRHSGGATEITVSFRERDGSGVILFEDNGRGIPPGMKSRIFYRGVGKNTGYGLFLVREILGITGITIEETGEEGKGARFEIVVPPGAWRTCDFCSVIRAGSP
ncbi:MAG TPA: PAS domain S-box protein [Methanoculleus sp.]|nr:PAS domain S-box protein [Methanoculleus sp.]